MSLLNDFIEKQKAQDELDACRTVVAKHFPELVTGPGADLIALARNHDIEARHEPNTLFEGMIERDGDGIATIVIRRGLSKRRERFTVAHELGHWLLQEELLGTTKGKLFRGISRNEREVKDEERLANLIAAEILMPFAHLRNVFDPNRMGASLVRVCREFCVSRTAAVRRIADVFETNLLLLQIVPYYFHDNNSYAEIDDATYVTARCGTLMDRERTKFVFRPRYSEILAYRNVPLELVTPKGRIGAIFDIDSRPTPIPHLFAIASVSQWKN